MPASSLNTPYTPDKLIAGPTYRHSEKGILLLGEGALARGTLLGKVTATGKYRKCVSGNADGSQNPNAILVQDADSTSADAEAEVYLTGDFDKTQVTFGAGVTAVTSKDALRALGIFLITVQS